MATKVIMPALGMAQETGKIIEWLKSEGDSVVKGEPIISIETDKVTVEIEANASGQLSSILARNGDDVPVGEVIAWITAPGEVSPHSAAQVVQQANPSTSQRHSGPPLNASLTPVAARVAAAHNIDPRLVPSTGGRVQKADVLSYLDRREQMSATHALYPASPKARRGAQEHGLDISVLTGSGPDGAVLSIDVADALARVSSGTVTASHPTPLPVMWRVMADRVSASWRDIPHFHLIRDVNAETLTGWYKSLQGQSPKITYTDLLVKLVALTLVKHPRMNSSWQNNGIVQNERIGIGIAVAVEDGLLVPVIPDADRLPLRDIASRRQAVVARALAGTLGVEDVHGGTFTISNLGMYGVDGFSAIINPPNSGILAVGRIADRVVPVNGVPSIRPMMTLNVACDHRVLDGARAAEFLGTLIGLIENPLSGIY